MMTRTRRTPRHPRRFVTVGIIPPTDATVPAVVAWVGDDSRRAQAAYDAEHAKGDAARSSLLNQLVRLGAVPKETP